MWDLDHNLIPPTLSSQFNRCTTVHQQNTRHAEIGKFIPKKTHTKHHGTHSFQVQGTLILNGLKDLDIYNNAPSKETFLKHLKKSLIDNY